MRSYSVLVVFSLAFLALVGAQLLSWQSVEAAIPISVEIEPDTLNLAMRGSWITILVEPPEEYLVSDINMSTVTLEEVLLPARWDIQNDTLMLKFPAEEVISLIWLKIYHMGSPAPKDMVQVELTVTGEFNDSVAFEGSDEIQVIAPSV